MELMDWVTLGVASLGLVVALGAVGLVSYVRQESLKILRPPPRPEPKAICGCTHHASFHDEEGCHYIHPADRYENNSTEHECGCVKYIGPEPLPEYLP